MSAAGWEYPAVAAQPRNPVAQFRAQLLPRSAPRTPDCSLINAAPRAVVEPSPIQL
jgi:hypothetical protein